MYFRCSCFILKYYLFWSRNSSRIFACCSSRFDNQYWTPFFVLVLNAAYLDSLKLGPRYSLTLDNALQTFQLTYSSVDNFGPSILVSDSSIFCSGNLILHNKRNRNNKNTNFMMKNNKKMTKKYMKAKSSIFIANSLCWLVNMLQTFGKTEKLIVLSFCQTNTLLRELLTMRFW